MLLDLLAHAGAIAEGTNTGGGNMRRPAAEAARESVIDEESLARLEAMQKRQMIDVFGFDYEKEEEERAKRKELEAAERTKSRLAHEATSAGTDIPSRRKKKKGRTVDSAGAGGSEDAEAMGWARGGRKRSVEMFGEEFGISVPKCSGASVAGAERKQFDRPENERERGTFMSSKVTNIYGAEHRHEELRGRKFRRDRNDDELGSTARMVEQLGASMFVGREKKAWELKRLKALGAKAPKNEKTPIFILKGMRAKAKEREEKRKVMELQAGLAVKKTKKKGGNKSVMSLNTSGVMRVDPKMDKRSGHKSMGGVLKTLGRANKSRKKS